MAVPFCGADERAQVHGGGSDERSLPVFLLGAISHDKRRGIAGVVFFTYLGDWIREADSSVAGSACGALSPRWARLWERYGLWGVAFLTPPILSPPLGTAIALAFGTPRPHIVARMTLAMIFWGFFFAGLWESLQQFIPF